MDVAKYAIAIAATLFCFWKAYEEGRAEGRYQGFVTALHDFAVGEMAVDGEELVFGPDAAFVLYDPKTGARVSRLRRDELDFEAL